MGEEAEQIATQITVRAPIAANETANIAGEDAEGTLFQRTLEGFDNYFNPRNNHLHYAVMFGSRVQLPDETNEQFIRNLHELAAKCGWEDRFKTDMLRTRLLAGMKDKTLSRELQINANITLDEIKQQMRTKEIILQNQQAEMDGEASVMAIRRSSYNHGNTNNNSSSNDCIRKPPPHSGSLAGANSHGLPQGSNTFITNCKFCSFDHARGRCKAYGKRCNSCGRFNHFSRSKACRLGPSNNESYSGKPTTDTNGKKVLVNEVSVDHSAVNDCEDVFHVNQIDDFSTGNVNPTQWFVNVNVQGSPLKLLVDTGSEVSVLPKNTFCALGLTKVTGSNATLAGYSGQNIPVIGKVSLPVELKGAPIVDTTFYVTDDAVDRTRLPLLVLPAIRALGLIPVESSVNVNQVSSKSSIEEHRNMRSIIDKHSNVFEGLGHFGADAKLQLKEGATPRAIPPRQVPYSMRDKLKQELDRLEQLGVICKDSEPVEWLSPLVIINKPKGDIRLCLDPQYLNSQLIRSHCVIPRTSEIFSRVTGSQIFSTLDAKNGFHQIGLDETSSKLTSFVTPFGKYCYLRLPMGICNAPELFHQRMLEAFSDIPGVEVYLDDVLIHACDMLQHNQRLSMVLERCNELGITLNPEKCVYAKESIGFLGHEISSSGVRPAHSKVQAVQNMVQPEDKKAVERFLGFVNYLAKFIPHLSEHTYPLRQVCKKNVQFWWGKEQSEAFEKIKILIKEAPTLSFYDPSLPVTLTADSSAHSLGAVVLQNGKPIEFAAKSLTDTQQRYSQIEKELLGVVFACKRFKYYCWGLENIKIETDHLPLVGILEKDINLLSPRIAAMRLELMSYPIHFDLVYKPGREMVLADTLSRACPQDTDLCEDLEQDALLSVCSVVIRSSTVMHKYQLATENDEELVIVRKYIEQGWPSEKKSCGNRALAFWNLRNSLSVVSGVVFYGSRLVIPIALRSEVVDELHKAHQGVTKTLQRAAASVFFPGIRKRLTEKCLSCVKCCEVDRAERKEPLVSYPVPQYPYQMVGVDLFSLESKSYLMIVDYLSKWPVVRQLNNATTSNTITQMLKEVFSELGIPEKIISDNGPQFTSTHFRAFCNDLHIEHSTSSPMHSSGNGQVERTIGTVKSMMKKCGESDWWKGLLAIRNTPVGDGLPSPSELLQGRILRDKLPVDTNKYKVNSYDLEQVRAKLGTIKSKDKYYHDRHSGPEKAMLGQGQQVYFRSQSQGWIKGKVVSIVSDRSYIVESPGGNRFRRNRKDLRPSNVDDRSLSTPGQVSTSQCLSSLVGVPGRVGNSADVASLSDMEMPGTGSQNAALPSSVEPVQAPTQRHSGRQITKPKWHGDYVFY